MIRKKRVVITGIGPICSIGTGKKDLWKNILESKTGLTEQIFEVDKEVLDKYYLHKIHKFDIDNFGINKDALNEIRDWKEGDEINDLYYFLACVKLSLEDSKLEYDPTLNKIGIVLTAESPGYGDFYIKFLNKSYDLIISKTERNKKLYSKRDFFYEFFHDFRKTGYDLQTFMSLFHVAKTFQFHGYSLFINNACASGLYALEIGADIIRSNKCSAVVIAAVDYPDVFKSLWFKEINMCPRDGRIKPFDNDADGFVLGEGGVAVVLEDLDSAIKRKAHIYAEYLGGGFSLEGWKVTLPAIGNNFYRRCLEEALKESKLKTTDVDLIVPHGVGTVISDSYEARAIFEIFGDKSVLPLITAFKPYVGHTLGANALLETVILLLCLENNIVLPTLNFNEANSKLKITLVKEKIDTQLNVVIKMCSAFAGYDAAAVFKKLS